MAEVQTDVRYLLSIGPAEFRVLTLALTGQLTTAKEVDIGHCVLKQLMDAKVAQEKQRTDAVAKEAVWLADAVNKQRVKLGLPKDIGT